MESVRNVYIWLKSAELVADFQKYCGIKLKSVSRESESRKNVCTSVLERENGVILTNGNVHKGTNGYIKPHATNGIEHKNGFVKRNICTEEIRTKNGFCTQVNGVVQNGSVQSELSSENTQYINHITERKSDYDVKNKFYYLLFLFGASLGNELFYLTFFPFLIWNVDCTLLRRMAFVWHLAMWLGQAAKDVICWPRPASPPVVKMEHRYGLEYGMPSTHSLVGAVIPFCLLFIGSEVYKCSLLAGLPIAFTWAILVGGSRMYLGMHTALDVLAGYLCACVLIPLVLPWVATLDHLQVTHPLAPLVTTLIYLCLCWVYPKQKVWNTARADTANVHGICGGVATGAWLNYQLGWLTYTQELIPYELQPLTSDWLLYSLLRTLVGVVILVGIRGIFKPLSIKFLCRLYKINEKKIDEHRKYGSEVPQKFITYYMVSIGGSFLVPLLFHYLGIGRSTYYRELY
ncbi:hypothetical protein FSP39_003831 [Pinctada imbricata]|uniref:Phosphatidic acid phosphatase type 2/haloperoxidase domain-containing protein n=1 Tax=Pinctada imbricata TaxID=66713 RepID=A0AA88XVB8_PINIB|nr:hypothetical protein FSP39_003831 [Pinctada imbricata]